jgi:hypothetical protein
MNLTEEILLKKKSAEKIAEENSAKKILLKKFAE